MATYSIRDLQRLSGIKAHTIRIWEQRYNIIDPKRTPSNIRYYTEDDLKFLMNIAFLNRKGIRISKIAKMSVNEISSQVDNLSKTEAETNDHFQALAVAMLELNEEKVCTLLEQSMKQFGVERTILEILTPFLEKASMLWLSGSISAVHEQFVSALIRRKVLNAINLLPKDISPANKKVLLYIPDFEQQELYLIFAEYLLKKRNLQVVYLGCKISIEELRFACSVHQPDFIYTIVSEQHKRYVPQHYVGELCEAINPVHLLVSGFDKKGDTITNSNISLVDDLNELIEIL